MGAESTLVTGLSHALVVPIKATPKASPNYNATPHYRLVHDCWINQSITYCYLREALEVISLQASSLRKVHAGQEIAGEMILYLGGIVMRTDDSYTQIFTKQVVPPTRRYFHPLYRGTWFPTSRVTAFCLSTLSCFHPLYRGTWFPTPGRGKPTVYGGGTVSIRYIAVLGFQPYLKNAPSDQRRRKRFTHPPSNRSHSHICFLKFQ